MKGALAAARKQRGFDAAKIVGLGVDTTGSSPIPVDRNNRPLALDKKWRKNLHAQCWLWKDHTSVNEAARITGIDLLTAKARGGDVRIVYSPLDAVTVAKENPAREVVFFAVGFETTACTTG